MKTGSQKSGRGKCYLRATDHKAGIVRRPLDAALNPVGYGRAHRMPRWQATAWRRSVMSWRNPPFERIDIVEW